MSDKLQTVIIFPLSGLSQSMTTRIRNGRLEAAKVWNLCRDLHLEARKTGTKWPGRDSLQQAVKGGTFALHSQSAQMVCHAFLANVKTTRELRKKGNKQIRYPYRDKMFYPLAWPAQAMCLTEKSIVLPMGRNNPSLVLPKPVWLNKKRACKLVWNGSANELHITVETDAAQEPPGENKAAVDLGQIHQAAVATDTGYALIVSGRGIRSEKQRLNKLHGKMGKMLARCTRGSRRWKKLRRKRSVLAARTRRRIRDLRHKGTRKVIDFCIDQKVGQLYVGNPKGVRKKKSGRKHNQRMSQWEYGKDIAYLRQKAAKAAIECFTGTERGTSSRCPECGRLKKPQGRVWTCPACGFTGHRDIVGAINIFTLAFDTKIVFPSLRDLTYLRPNGQKHCSIGSSSRLDTGRGHKARVAVEGMIPTKPNFGVSQETGQGYVLFNRSSSPSGD